MYLEHFGLKEKPFEPTIDPKYIWVSKENARFLREFKQAFLKLEGYLMLSGDVGSGKTAFMSCFLKLIENNALSAVIWDPAVGPLEFLNLLALGFRIDKVFETKTEFLDHYKSLVENAYLNHLKLLIVIDEAQNLNLEPVRELNRLMSIKIYGRKPVNVLFLVQRKKKKSPPPINQNSCNTKVIAHHHMQPLSPEDTSGLIKHRLKVAGTDMQIFSEEAMHEIFKFSAGNPRLINLICDRALLTGYVAGTTMISNSIVSECANELKISKLAP